MLTPQQELWQRQAAFSNLAAQGAAVQSSILGPVPGYPGSSQQRQAVPTWGGWAQNTEDDHRMDMENSSADSFPNSNFKLEPNNNSPSAVDPHFEADDLPKLETAGRQATSQCIKDWWLIARNVQVLYC